MTCYSIGDVHICAPTLERCKKKRLHCPTCQKRRTFVVSFYEWYGWYATCLGCGERWSDGEMLPRPFKPRWRKESIEEARKHYRKYAQASTA